MSEFHFLLFRGRMPEADEAQIDAIVRDEGGDCFLCVTLPGDGPRGWACAENRGHPFDRDLSDRVTKRVIAAGLGHHFGWEGER